MSPARAQPPMGSVDGPVSRVAGPAGSDPTRCSSPHSLPRALKPSQTYWRSKLPPSVLNPQALPSSLRAGPATPSPTVRTGGSCGVLSTEPDRRLTVDLDFAQTGGPPLTAQCADSFTGTGARTAQETSGCWALSLALDSHTHLHDH